MSGSDVVRRRGRLVVLAGPSAVGKSTVVARLRDEVPELYFSVSATTRARREGETEGVDYHFVSGEEFTRLVSDGGMLEWAEIHGGLQRSGTPAGPVNAALAAGRPVLIEVDLAGARAIRAKNLGATLVFLAPPSWEVLRARLEGRGTESAEVRARRLDTARVELEAMGEFDRVVVNNEVNAAVAELVELLLGDSPVPVVTS